MPKYENKNQPHQRIFYFKINTNKTVIIFGFLLIRLRFESNITFLFEFFPFHVIDLLYDFRFGSLTFLIRMNYKHYMHMHECVYERRLSKLYYLW